MEQRDPKRRLNAVLLARRCHDRQIIHRILDLLEDGISERDFELKCAAVKTLADIGDPVALPRLEGLLEKKSLLHPILYRRLKLEIVRSLPAYPAAATGRLLQRLAAGPGRARRSGCRPAPRREKGAEAMTPFDQQPLLDFIRHLASAVSTASLYPSRAPPGAPPLPGRPEEPAADPYRA